MVIAVDSLESPRPSWLADPGHMEIAVGSHVIGDRTPALVVAEIGINHNGSVAMAKELVDAAHAAGADCAKFQMRDLPTLYRNHGDADDGREDLGSQYVLGLLNRFSLSDDELFEIFDYCKTRGITPLCTPWDGASLRALETYGMPAYKVASADLTNHELLRALGETGRPLLVSTGMSTEPEIIESVHLLQSMGTSYVLLHCNSTYPAPFKDVQLSYLHRLGAIGRCMTGYSGHERGYHVVIAAVALGAKVIEKHLSLDRSLEGNDHKVSLLPHEFAEMVTAIRQVEEAMGQGGERQISQGERMNRVVLAKSVVINRAAEKGDVIRQEMLEVKSPGQGLQPNRMGDLLGRRLDRDMDPGDLFYPSDVDPSPLTRRTFSFRRPWGLPVRYHDFRSLSRLANPDFLEFHMSSKDLEVPPEQIFDRQLDVGLVVHSPDLFPGDHILDLAASSASYRSRSIEELQRVIARTRAMQAWFPRAETPRIVVSLGGFTSDAPLPSSARAERYERVADSLGRLDCRGIELLAQTLPPFPWYRGGQLFCNLFVDPEDTAEFADRSGIGLCLDVAHSQLAANHRGRRLADWVDMLAPWVSHLHLVDATGVDGEGLQIGDGDVDWPYLAHQLEVAAPRASFIPEIWQGHVDEGQGFWIGLERLERWF